MVELLIVVAIIGVLAGMILVNFQNARERARDGARKRDFESMKTALRLYYNDFETYPDNDGSGRMMGCGAAGDQVCAWGSEFSAGSVVYMKFLPSDPLNTGSYVYEYVQTDAGDGFELTTLIENKSDTDATKSQARCGVGSGQTYVVCED